MTDREPGFDAEATRAMIASVLPPQPSRRLRADGGSEWEASLERIAAQADAAVLAGSLVAFGGKLTADDKRDILLSHQLVQMLVQRAREQGTQSNWFLYYRQKLERLGWRESYLPGSSPSTSFLPPDDIHPDTFQAIKSIGQPGSGLSAPALQRLEADPQAHQIMREKSTVADTAIFSFVPTVTVVDGRVETLLYQREVHQVASASRGWFFSEKAGQSERIAERLAVMVFRPPHFEPHRQTVLDTLRQVMERELYPL